MCLHQPPCPAANTPERDTAHILAFHPEQGRCLLCNGIVRFDTGELLPDGRIIAPCRTAGAAA